MKVDIFVVNFDRRSEHYKLVDEQENTIAITWSLTYAGIIQEALKKERGL